VPGTYLGRHPHGTQTYRHGRAKMTLPDRKVEGGEVTVRYVKPQPRPANRPFPFHLVGR
jgi:hypothetical protein